MCSGRSSCASSPEGTTRFAVDAEKLDERATKADLELAETISRLWHVDDIEDGHAVLAVVFTSTRIEESFQLGVLVDAFATSIRRQ